jgi:alkylation response protein AidB-like acyl-CoA dehydrogenase
MIMVDLFTAFSDADLAFAEEVRGWVRENYPDDVRKKVEKSVTGRIEAEEHIAWQRKLYAKGWLVPHWPPEWGGQPWSVTRLFLFRSILAEESVPDYAGGGMELLGPVLLTFATEEQKQRFLPDLLQANTWWAQGYSEPNAGSDLAALQMRADRQGDHYLVNGSKTWTSSAQKADWIFCLVRTSREERKQQGISFLLIDMRTAGVEVRPIITADGTPEPYQEVNEVVFTDVKVPIENLIGEEGNGWSYAKYLLEFERALPVCPALKGRLKSLKALAQKARPDGKVMWNAPSFHDCYLNLEIDIVALEALELDFLEKWENDDSPGALTSMLKTKGTEYCMRIDELFVDVAGYQNLAGRTLLGWDFDELPFDERSHLAAPIYLNGRKKAIYAGSNEIQRNIIAKSVLGLP